MTQITIETPRRVPLSGTFMRLVDCYDVAVVFSHTFLSDRYTSGMFDSLGRTLRRTGYATLTFDYSSCGTSGSGTITFDPLTEDFCFASGWLVNRGFVCQICVGHEFGVAVTLRPCLSAVQTYVLTSPVLDPLSYDWNLVFSDAQLSDLKYHGAMIVPDDSESARRQFTISKHAFADMSIVSGGDALCSLSVPVLITYDSFSEETGLFDRAREVFHLLPNGSFAEITTTPNGIAGGYTPVGGMPIIDKTVDRALATSGSAHLPTLADVAAKWASRWAPVSR